MTKDEQTQIIRAIRDLKSDLRGEIDLWSRGYRRAIQHAIEVVSGAAAIDQPKDES